MFCYICIECGTIIPEILDSGNPVPRSHSAITLMCLAQLTSMVLWSYGQGTEETKNAELSPWVGYIGK